MKLLINILAGLTLLSTPVAGEESNGDKQAVDSTAVETTWARFNVVERILELKDDNKIRWLYFRGGGSVSATLGTKEGGKKAIICSYRIVGDWLHIIDDYGKVIYQMRLIKVEKNEVIVENGSDEKERYEFYRNTPDKK